MPTLLGPLAVGHNIPIMGSLYDQNQSTKGKVNPFYERHKATLRSTAIEAIAQVPKGRDHVLLAV